MDNLEALLKAKIPCPETGIEIHHTVCAICSPGGNCGINAYVKDGKVIKVEGTDEHIKNHGMLCTKGLNNRQFIYREDRIMTPLKRTGERGSGEFKPISWDEAYDEICEKLLKIREEDGADAVAFFGGYNKWYRPWFRRFAHSFGTFNYGTESSTCMTAAQIARKLASGGNSGADMRNTDLFLGWAFNSHYSGYMRAPGIEKRKAAGMKLIIIDPKISPAVEKLADLHLRPYYGTDGALALTMANVLIQKGWIDKEYIEKYVHGFDEYAEYCKGFNEENVEKLTGVPFDQVMKACEMIHEAKSVSVNDCAAPLPHHANGVSNYRAIQALCAITGNFDRKGGQIPSWHTFTHQSSGYHTYEEEWGDATEPKNPKNPCIGSERFPLWFHLEREMQACDLARQILEEKPYKVKALLGLGMNYRMFPDSSYMKEALMKLDFVVQADLFMTDTAKLADIVLPVCSSFERGEFLSYAGCYGWFTKPAIERVGESKSDAEILCDLANRMNLDDEDLKAGYRANIEYMLKDLDITTEELLANEMPTKIPNVKPYQVGSMLEQGLPTPSGKYELYSEVIAAHPEWGLDPLPKYVDPLDDADPEKYPMVLCGGGSRIPNAIHSRLHKVPWARSLRPDPTADISLEDAEAMGIQKDDWIEIFTERGAITVKANPTYRILKGTVSMFHGYSEADVNSLMDRNHLDPYSGFPGYNSTRCGMRKKVTE